MKILYLDICHKYLGLTQSLIPALLSSLGEVTFFGPGYVDSEILKKGLDNFVEKEGDFDLVFASDSIVLSGKDASSGNKKRTAKSWSFSFPIDDLDLCFNMRAWFKKYKGLKFGFLLAFDAYVASEKDVEAILETDAYIVTVLGKTFTKSMYDIENLDDEKLSQNTNNWYDFVNKYSHKIIELPFFITANEFSFDRLKDRKNLWAIAGVPYADRKIARKVLIDNNVKVTGLGLARLWHVLLKMGVPLMSSDIGIAIMNAFFVRQINKAKYCYTDGSRLAYPVRKFFEIAARSSVLVCNPCYGFAELGFVDGQNAIICPPKNVLEVHNFLEGNKEKAQQIADAGARLILEKHSFYVRSKQLNEVVSNIKNNKYNGCVWKNGKLTILTKN